MCNVIYYSSEKNGFYHSAFHSRKEIPEDSIIISEDDYSGLIQGQEAGMEIHPDAKGRPFLTPPSAAPCDKKKSLISEADSIIRPMLGYATSGILSDTEKETFKAWNEYRKALEGVDVTAADIEWPDKPE